MLVDYLMRSMRGARHPVRTLARALVVRAAGDRVVGGPFRGMRLLHGHAWFPYLLGTQELELHELIERLSRAGFDRIVNVGASLGYYTIGMALRVPGAEVVAFEAEGSSREHLRAVAQANGVQNQVAIRGWCTPEALQEALAEDGKTLVIMDVEGGEIDLLQPDAIPALARAAILAEMHDLYVPECSSTLTERLQETHRIERYESRTRTAEDFPDGFLSGLRGVARRTVSGMLDEQRGVRQEWLYFEPRIHSPRVDDDHLNQARS